MAQQTFSSHSHPTVWCTILVLEFLQEQWGNMAASPKYVDLSNSITSGLDNIHKWYGKTDDMDGYFLCLSNQNFALFVVS